MLARSFVALALVVPALGQSFLFDPNREGPDARLSGRVVTPDGSPVPGAEVGFWARGDELASRGRATTNADGRFTLTTTRIARDGYDRSSFLTVEAAGFAPSQLERVFIPPPALDVGPIVLHRPVKLCGTVTRADGSRVAGAEIHAALGPVAAPREERLSTAPIAVSDSRGNYMCSVLPPGLVTLGASAEGLADTMLAPLELVPEKPNRVDFVLERGREVRVTVLDARGTPLPDARALPMTALNGIGSSRGGQEPRAFWRGVQKADAQGLIVVRGLDVKQTGGLCVDAPTHRFAWIALDGDSVEVKLEPAAWIDVVATRRGGGPAPEIIEVSLRDETPGMELGCGLGEDLHWVRLRADSPAVARLAPETWRIAWNTLCHFAEGHRIGGVECQTACGSAAFLDLPQATKGLEPGTWKLEFDAPARAIGRVTDERGKPVALCFGTQVTRHSPVEFLAVDSDADGRFEFDGLSAGRHRLDSFDEHWEIDRDHDELELAPGRTRTDVHVVVHHRPDGRTGRARGVVRIAGKVPGTPLLLALDEMPNQHLPSAYPRGFAWTDAEGRFEIGSYWPRAYHVLPKHTPRFGGWRDFAGEFPEHDERWRWSVDVPAEGTTYAVIDLPLESEWDHVAPPSK